MAATRLLRRNGSMACLAAAAFARVSRFVRSFDDVRARFDGFFMAEKGLGAGRMDGELRPSEARRAALCLEGLTLRVKMRGQRWTMS